MSTQSAVLIAEARAAEERRRAQTKSNGNDALPILLALESIPPAALPDTDCVEQIIRLARTADPLPFLWTTSVAAWGGSATLTSVGRFLASTGLLDSLKYQASDKRTHPPLSGMDAVVSALKSAASA